MALSSVVKHFSDGTLTIEDGTAGTTISLVLDFSNGDLSVEGLQHKLRPVLAYQTRGALKSIRHGEREFPTFSFTAMLTDFSEATSGTIFDVVAKDGAFGSAVSTYGANADVLTYKLTWDVEGTDFGDSADHQITLDDCHITISVTEGQPNTFNVSGTVYGAVGGNIALAEG